MNNLKPIDETNWEAFQGLEEFPCKNKPFQVEVLVDGSDATMLIGRNGVVICTEEGRFEKKPPKDWQGLDALANVMWWLHDELSMVWCDEYSYDADTMTDQGWEFTPAGN